jgi:hypothetical protein
VSNGRGRSANDFRLAFRRIRDDYTRRFERNVTEARSVAFRIIWVHPHVW